MWHLKLVACLALCVWGALVVIAFANRWRTRRRYRVAKGATVIGFFHPFCAGGGGGERVLWRAVRTLAKLSKDLGRPFHVLIYTGDVDVSPADILSGVTRQFEISIDPSAVPVSFVYLRGRGLLDPSLYPTFTMCAQSMASMALAAEALFRATPDVFVDTTGFAFSFPIAWLASCSVGAYVHYPTISMVSPDGQHQPVVVANARGTSSKLQTSNFKLQCQQLVRRCPVPNTRSFCYYCCCGCPQTGLTAAVQ